MNLLNEDVQIIILSFLCPDDIYSLFYSCDLFQKMLQELSSHKGFIVDCKMIIKDLTIDWFQKQNIKLNLFVCQENFWGDFVWLKNGKWHRDHDLPAITRRNGRQEWYLNGKLNRINDLPAVVYPDGRLEWYQNNRLHRDNDLPAVIHANGRKDFYKNNVKYKSSF